MEETETNSESNSGTGMNDHTEPSLLEETLDPATPEAWAELRITGHKMLDDMLDYLATVRQRPVWQAVPVEVKRHFESPAPLDPEPLSAVYEEFSRFILPYPHGNIHPRFWGWVEGTGTPIGMLADLLAAGMNPMVGGFEQSAVLVERQVIRWLAELLGVSTAASGLLVSGATAANLIGLTVARNTKARFDVRTKGLQGNDIPRLLVYASTETHGWASKSCELLGLGRRALRQVPINRHFQMEVDTLRSMLVEDRQAGHCPICVIGNAGTVNTGATDDLRELASICRKEDIWFHIDGAFGAMAALAPELKPLVAGMEQADSLAFDLHKWGYVPYEAGCILVRDETAHRAAFATLPAYLHPAKRGVLAEPLFFANLGVQLSRGFRALKVWMSLKTQGARAWGRLIRQNVEQARYLATLIEKHADLELLTPVALNIVCFRYRRPGLDERSLDRLNETILVELQERGIAVPSGTTLGGRFALRVANTNQRSRREDFDALVEAVREIGCELAGVVPTVR